MGSVETFWEMMYSGDPLVRQWFLVRNDYLPLVLCFTYACVSKIGPRLMKHRQPFEIRNVMIVFNFSIVCTYFTLLAIAAYYLPKISWQMFCYGGNLVEGTPEHTLVIVAWYGYVLKYIEFLDTIFFILRKKENHISFLHVFHHTSVPLLGWILFRTEKTGFQAIPGVINSIVHVFMYSYYGLAAIGPSVHKYLWWKKYLTQMQLTQFILIIVITFVLPPLTGCPVLKLSHFMNAVFGPIFFFLFYRFYRTSFSAKKKVI